MGVGQRPGDGFGQRASVVAGGEKGLDADRIVDVEHGLAGESLGAAGLNDGVKDRIRRRRQDDHLREGHSLGRRAGLAAERARDFGCPVRIAPAEEKLVFALPFSGERPGHAAMADKSDFHEIRSLCLIPRFGNPSSVRGVVGCDHSQMRRRSP